MIIRILLACIIAISLTMGCGVDHGRVKIDDKSIEVEAGRDGDKSRDGFCPPGHRKKGWCD